MAFAATSAQAQSICTPLLGGSITCVGGTPTVPLAAPVLAPPPIAGPVTVTLADGFQSPDTVAITTVGAGSNVTLNALGSAVINTVNQPGLVIDSAGSITAQVTDITTSGDGSTGALLRAVDSIVFTSDGTISTTGNNAPAIDAQGRSVTVDANILRTAGDNSTAAQLTSLNGPTSLNVGLIQTDGNLSRGAVLSGTGTSTLTGGGITTNGANAGAFAISNDAAACVVLGTGGCDKTVTLDNVTTNGFGSVGGLITGAGRTDVTIGTLQTGGTDAGGLNISTDPTACIALGAGACGTAFTIDNLTTQGARSPGAVVTGGGPISANVGVLSTGGDQAAGLNLASDPTACAVLGAGQCGTSFTVGQLTTSGAGSTGALIRSAGPTSGNVGVLRTSGANAAGIDIASNPTTCVIAGAGACDVGLTANDVATSGDGAAGVLIQPAGNVTTTIGQLATTGNGSTGLGITQNPTTCLAIGPGACQTTATVGSASTRGANARAISIDGANGPVVLNAGSVATSGPNSDGVNVLTSTGDQTIAAGPVTVTGAGSNAIVAVATGCGQIDVTATAPITSAQGTAILASSTCGVNVTTLPGAAVAGRLAGINVTSGTGARITVADAVSSAAGPAINADGAAALVTIAPTGTVNGFVDLTPGDDQLINNGTFNAIGDSAFGAGTDRFVNAGRFALRPGATTAGTVGLTGLEAFANSGTIDLRNGVVGDRLTLPGTYTGSGAATLGVDVGTGGASDRLIVGGAASGSTNVLATGLDGRFVSNAIVVDAGTGTSASAFVLPAQRVGLVDYALNFDAANNDFLLSGTPSTVAIGLGQAGEIGREVFYRGSDGISAHLDHALDGAGGDGRVYRRLWMDGFGAVQSRHRSSQLAPFGVARSYDLNLTQDWFGAQIGYDLVSTATTVAGVAATYTNSRSRLESTPLRFKDDAVGATLYGRTGFGAAWLAGQARYEHHRFGFRDATGAFSSRSSGNAYGGRVEAGLRLGGATAIEPIVSLDYAHFDLDPVTIAGTAVDFGMRDGLRGKAGVRVSTPFGAGPVPIIAYLRADAIHEFRGQDAPTLTNSGLTFGYTVARPRTYGEATAGLDIGLGTRVRGFIEGHADFAGGVSGGGARAGLSVAF